MVESQSMDATSQVGASPGAAPTITGLSSVKLTSGSSICGRIATHAVAVPDRLALADGIDRVTFAELENRSNQLAAYLQAAGARPEQCVGLFLERSAQFVVAALAVLKTGAAYLPLDSSTPADRAAFILADAGVHLLLTHRGKAREMKGSKIPATWRVIELDGSDAAQIARQQRGKLQVEPAPDSLAYVIYTSGSTGRPKGVEITHANLDNLVRWHQLAFDVEPVDRASQVAGLGFDAAVWEIWPHVTAGASLHIADESTRREPAALRDWLISEKITISFVPTVLAEQLIQMDWPSETALRTLLTGADTLRRRPPASVPFVFVNNYGPTECTVVATSGTVAPVSTLRSLLSDDNQPSIGYPIDNATVLILDDTLHPVSDGEIGELCIAGALVGRGYRNNPELTASRFSTYTPVCGPSLRIYRTGDRARLLPNGEIAFVGRLDEQIKIRGYRVELGEISACLNRCPGVNACAVVPRDPSITSVSGQGANGRNGDMVFANGPVLVAYVVTANDAQLTASGLREFLAAQLPDYMIPAHFVTIDALPLTANGKLDKSSLPAPTADRLLPIRADHETPELGNGRSETIPGDPLPAPDTGGSVTQQIAALVASLLGQPSVGLEENFFMIGGHSMLGAQLVAQIWAMFGVRISLRQLFTEPTIAALSAEVKHLQKG